MPKQELVAHKSLPEFFKETIHLSLHSLQVQASPEAEFYLVHLLTTFSQAEKFFDPNEEGSLQDKALAIRYFEAVLASPSKKISALKKMGDVALYTSGFFADSFFKKIVGADYYIQMGEAAYASVSHLMNATTGRTIKDLFSELAANFIRFVDVLSDVADRSYMTSDKTLLKLYERWLATGSQRVYDLLIQEGMIPNQLVKTGYTQ